MVIVVTRTLSPEDVDPLATAFASWPKTRELFQTYARRVSQGSLDVVVAAAEVQLLGYLLIEPMSSYPPFAGAGIPEIADFNVLRSQQRSGVGTALMDEAERRVAQFSHTVGLGVGLYSGYGTAQRMYVRRATYRRRDLMHGAGHQPTVTAPFSDSDPDSNDHRSLRAPGGRLRVTWARRSVAEG